MPTLLLCSYISNESVRATFFINLTVLFRFEFGTWFFACAAILAIVLTCAANEISLELVTPKIHKQVTEDILMSGQPDFKKNAIN